MDWPLRFLSVAVLGLLVASPVRATNFVDYSNWCGFHSTFVTCASFRIFTTALSAGHTQIEIQARNLEGTHPAATLGSGWISFFQ